MNFPVIFYQVKQVLSEPARFFKQLKTETGIKSAFTYLLMLGLWNSALGLLVTLLFNDYSYNLIFRKVLSTITSPGAFLPQPTTGETIFWGVLGYGLLLGLSFIKVGILHGWICLFGGKEKYAKTYQLYIYSSTPAFVLGWIPFIGFFTWIYDMVLLIIGTQKIHKISPLKSVLMYLIPIVLFILFLIATCYSPLVTFSRALINRSFSSGNPTVTRR